MLRWVVGASLVLAGLVSAAVADDGVLLQVSYGPAAGEVRLDWGGGQPSFKVYRSSSAAMIVTAANKLGETSGNLWLDTPPAGGIFYYRIVGPCQTPSVERCDGVDDDCDGLLDNGCPGFCTDDLGCGVTESCDAAINRCVPDVADGQVCARDEQCLANHCANSVCCAGGDCCTTDAQCAGYGWTPRCDDASTCQGTSGAGACGATFQCGAVTTQDDSACAGRKSQTCGPYPSIACTAEVSQPADQAALCSGSCATDSACDTEAFCDAAGHCLPDQGLGAACSGGSQCASGACVDDVCCNSACNGTCQACDLFGSVGACSLVANGGDPDAECPGIGCIGYYHSWSGDSCRRKADVSATTAACDGAGACRSVSQECTAQTAVGPTVLTCDALCQDPNLATCAGTIAGTCTNVNPGNQSCGNGVCRVTVPQCSNGAPLVCSPNSGAAGPETCNNLDDNCDGIVDNGSFGDTREPNGTCAAAMTLPTVGSDQTLTQNSLTIYPSGDVDYFRIVGTETDSTCACCDFFCTQEDYKLNVTLTVPAGAGSYSFCTDLACANVGNFCQTVNAGQSFTWTFSFDGMCTTTDSYAVFVRVSPGGSPGFTCAPYILSYNLDALVCN
ncbi:MAG TPA: hypothetical protein VGS03_01115 [Candidatus Polarisedimenticolia bacterium]|jgi:hypothetical protein|nr:hypothetical protein [Candidatus Polarisedimenticolia bacterium]